MKTATTTSLAFLPLDRSPLAKARRAALLPLLIAALAAPSPAAEGDLDSSFDGDGRVAVGFDLGSLRYDAGWAVVPLPQERVALVGYVGNASDVAEAGAARLLASGALDGTFGSGGKVRYGFSTAGSPSDTAIAAVAQPDGKLVLVGATFTDAHEEDFLVVRLLANGALDPGFGAGGRTVITVSEGPDLANAVALRADGRIVVAGTAQGVGDSDMAVVQLTAAGAPDASFGPGGVRLVDFGLGGNGDDAAFGVAIAGDGDVVLAGRAEVAAGPVYDFAVARLRADGAPESGFGSGTGRVTVPFDLGGEDSDEGGAVALDPLGRIVVAGSAQQSSTVSAVAVVRLLATGALDSSFGGGGKTTFAFDPGNLGREAALGLIRQSDGRLVVSGSTFPAAGQSEFGVARLLESGALDPSFSSDGRTKIGFVLGTGNSQAFGTSVAISGGKLVVAGQAKRNEPADFDFAAARLTINLLWADGAEWGELRAWSAISP